MIKLKKILESENSRKIVYHATFADYIDDILNYINHKGCATGLQLQKIFCMKETIDEKVIAGLAYLINRRAIDYSFTKENNYYYSKEVRH